MLKIAIVGYGKMGKEIEKILLAQNLLVSVIIDNEQDWSDSSKIKLLAASDVAVEFSQPDVAVQNILRCFDLGVSVVCGTTGWYHQMSDVLKKCQENSSSFVFGSNFSIGANLFFDINRVVAQIMQNYTQYAPSIEEIHHLAKKDAPSGTAITTANVLLSELQFLKEWRLQPFDSDTKEVLPITSYREGEVTGVHKVVYNSPNDDIQIVHTAHSRAMLAEGAVKAAVWLVKNPGIYDFSKIYNQL